jgi:hypothetical protein
MSLRAPRFVSLAFTFDEPSRTPRRADNLQQPSRVGASGTEERNPDMKRTILFATGAVAFAFAAAAPADAQRWRPNAWRTIAYTQVNGARDTDTIRLPGTARYRQMRLCVYGGPLHMRDVDVRYANGGHQDIGVRQRMRAGTCTRNVDLNGRYRDVRLIRLKYNPISRGWVRPIVRVQVR